VSHFSVVVCLDDLSKLDSALAPFDENREVEPYKAYEKEDPRDYWGVSFLREKAGLNPDEASLTWAQIAEAHNTHWDDSPPMLIDEAGRAYTMTTSNPDGYWDYWRVGGRWGGYFTYLADDPRLLKPSRDWGSPDLIMPNTCDGGPKALLDIAGMRGRAADKAREDHAKWLVAVDGTPEALPWSTFATQVGECPGYTIDQAREEYRSQPRMAALQGTSYGAMWDCPIEAYQKPTAVFVELARAKAVPGYALVTLDGKWMAPGRMGWFGMSTDTPNHQVGYYETANAYIEALPDDACLVAVDCHV
jgi:hypothetical protein